MWSVSPHLELFLTKGIQFGTLESENFSFMMRRLLEALMLSGFGITFASISKESSL